MISNNPYKILFKKTPPSYQSGDDYIRLIYQKTGLAPASVIKIDTNLTPTKLVIGIQNKEKSINLKLKLIRSFQQMVEEYQQQGYMFWQYSQNPKDVVSLKQLMENLMQINIKVQDDLNQMKSEEYISSVPISKSKSFTGPIPTYIPIRQQTQLPTSTYQNIPISNTKEQTIKNMVRLLN